MKIDRLLGILTALMQNDGVTASAEPTSIGATALTPKNKTESVLQTAIALQSMGGFLHK